MVDPAAPSPLHALAIDWYAGAARPLPWRCRDVTPWGILVSEVMLQQTPAARVAPVWSAWLLRWPAPADLAGEPPGEAVRAWGRLGYPRRALRLHTAAAAIRDSHGGQVPEAYDALRSLPGVGAYTAAAVASFAFGGRHAVLDTNVRRVHARAVGGSEHPAAALSVAEVRRAEALLPDDPDLAPGWAAAIMELGALVCTARSPRCAECPLQPHCAWRLAGAPRHDGPPRRGHAWEGTDRMVRGRLLAALRGAAGAVDARVLDATWPQDPAQRQRCLAGLVDDGLVEPLAAGRYRLPGVTEPDTPRLSRR